MNEQKEKHRPKRAKGVTLGLGTRGKLILAAVVLALLLGGYTALCAAVNTAQILPKTVVNGVALPGGGHRRAGGGLRGPVQRQSAHGDGQRRGLHCLRRGRSDNGH
ncbi:MAG: hypothetical protein LUD84_02065 [Clostridiales bacterium]|nr:hypothetical protein [Clostridiales bacterium]